MDDYIKRNDVYELFPNSGFARLHVADIDKIPASDVEPIIPAFWKPVYETEISGYGPALSGRDPVGAYVCTNCGAEAIFDCNDQFVLSERCHKCGAHMDAPETPKE